MAESAPPPASTVAVVRTRRLTPKAWLIDIGFSLRKRRPSRRRLKVPESQAALFGIRAVRRYAAPSDDKVKRKMGSNDFPSRHFSYSDYPDRNIKESGKLDPAGIFRAGRRSLGTAEAERMRSFRFFGGYREP